MKIQQTPFTDERKTHIFEAFGKHAIDSMGINGFAPDPISLEIHDGVNFIGCIVVQIVWGQLHIKFLLIEEPYRRQGYGRRLLEQAFEFGKQQGCNIAFVETMNYQAPELYQKLGFEIEFKRTGFDVGTSMYYLKKDL